MATVQQIQLSQAILRTKAVMDAMAVAGGEFKTIDEIKKLQKRV